MESQDERFRSIYEYYMPLLRKMAQLRGIPYDEVDDIVQDTFTSYYDHYHGKLEKEKIRPMLARILRNSCTDYFRRSSVRPVSYMDPDQMQELNVAGMTEKDALTIVLEHQVYRDLLEALKTMRKDWAAVFMMYTIQGRPMKDVGEALGVSEAACRTRLTRGRKYLRERLEREDSSMPAVQRKKKEKSGGLSRRFCGRDPTTGRDPTSGRDPITGREPTIGRPGDVELSGQT